MRFLMQRSQEDSANLAANNAPAAGEEAAVAAAGAAAGAEAAADPISQMADINQGINHLSDKLSYMNKERLDPNNVANLGKSMQTFGTRNDRIQDNLDMSQDVMDQITTALTSQGNSAGLEEAAVVQSKLDQTKAASDVSSSTGDLLETLYNQLQDCQKDKAGQEQAAAPAGGQLPVPDETKEMAALEAALNEVLMKFTLVLGLALVASFAAAQQYDCSAVDSTYFDYCDAACNNLPPDCSARFCRNCVESGSPTPTPDANTYFAYGCDPLGPWHSIDDDYCTDLCTLNEDACPDCCFLTGTTPSTPTPEDETNYYAFCDSTGIYHALTDQMCTDLCNGWNPACPPCCYVEGTTPTATPTPTPFYEFCDDDSIYHALTDESCTTLCNGANPECPPCCYADGNTPTATPTPISFNSYCSDDLIYHAIDDDMCTTLCTGENPECPPCCYIDGTSPTPTPTPDSDGWNADNCDGIYHSVTDTYCTNNCPGDACWACCQENSIL